MCVQTRLIPHWKRAENTNTEGAVGNVPYTKPNVLISLFNPRASSNNCVIRGINILQKINSNVTMQT